MPFGIREIKPGVFQKPDGEIIEFKNWRYQPIYGSVQVAGGVAISSGTRSAVFNTNTDKRITNLSQNNRLERGTQALVRSIGIEYQPNTVYASLNQDELAADTYKIRRVAHFELVLGGTKVMSQGPLSFYPANIGIDQQYAIEMDNQAAATDIRRVNVNNGTPHGHQTPWEVPIHIGNEETFSGNIIWEEGITPTNAWLLRVIMWSILGEPVR